jgi:hypothetical protein
MVFEVGDAVGIGFIAGDGDTAPSGLSVTNRRNWKVVDPYLLDAERLRASEGATVVVSGDLKPFLLEPLMLTTRY